VDSNGTEHTEIDEEAQDDSGVKSPNTNHANGEVQSPDIEIKSPQSAGSVGHPFVLSAYMSESDRLGRNACTS
jgi:hypothetical protein